MWWNWGGNWFSSFFSYTKLPSSSPLLFSSMHDGFFNALNIPTTTVLANSPTLAPLSSFYSAPMSTLSFCNYPVLIQLSYCTILKHWLRLKIQANHKMLRTTENQVLLKLLLWEWSIIFLCESLENPKCFTLQDLF